MRCVPSDGAGCSCGSLPRALEAAVAPVRPWLRSDAMAALPACASHDPHRFALQVTHLWGLGGMLQALLAIRRTKCL